MSSSHRLAAVLLCITMVLAACGDSADIESQRSPSPSPPVSPSPSPAASPSPELSPEPSPLPPSPPPPAEPPPPPPPPQPAVQRGPPSTGVAPQGTYIFSQSGSVSTRGCLNNVQEVPDAVRVSVYGPGGNRQRIVRDNLNEGSVSSELDLTLEYRDDGAYLVSLKQSQTVALQTLAFEFQAEPPVRLIPAYPEVGQTLQFNLTSPDGQVHMDTTVTVEALAEPVTLVRGDVLQAHRIRTVSRVTGTSSQGSLDVIINRVTWYSPEIHLEIKDSSDIDGTVGLCRVDSHVESLARDF